MYTLVLCFIPCLSPFCFLFTVSRSFFFLVPYLQNATSKIVSNRMIKQNIKTQLIISDRCLSGGSISLSQWCPRCSGTGPGSCVPPAPRSDWPVTQPQPALIVDLPLSMARTTLMFFDVHVVWCKYRCSGLRELYKHISKCSNLFHVDLTSLKIN